MRTENVLLSGHSVYAYGIPKGVFRGRQSIVFPPCLGFVFRQHKGEIGKERAVKGVRGVSPKKYCVGVTQEKAEQ